jgi:hypothetical protein
MAEGHPRGVALLEGAGNGYSHRVVWTGSGRLHRGVWVTGPEGSKDLEYRFFRRQRPEKPGPPFLS